MSAFYSVTGAASTLGPVALRLAGVTVSGNRAWTGGGGVNLNSIAPLAPGTSLLFAMDRCAVLNNTANSTGGGVSVGASQPGTVVELNDCTFTGVCLRACATTVACTRAFVYVLFVSFTARTTSAWATALHRSYSFCEHNPPASSLLALHADRPQVSLVYLQCEC